MSGSATYSYRFTLPVAPVTAFDLLSRPRLLNALTPRWFDLQPIGSQTDALAPGAVIPYRLRWHGLPLRWASRIVEWDPPHRLTYEQVRGPYRCFRHEHFFSARGDSTVVLDRVLYRVYGGRLFARWVVEPDLRRIFAYRATAALELLAAPAAPAER